MGKIPTSKRRTRKSFWVFFLMLQLTTLERKSKKKLEIFLDFFDFRKQANKKGKSKNEKNYLHGKTPNKQKKNKEIFSGFLFSTTTI